MTPEQQRVAIAQACGWKTQVESWPKGNKTTWLDPSANQVCGQTFPPDYLNDLNAMHEAEKALTWQQHLTFRKQLWDLVITLGPEDTWDRQFISATAAQRAEAFLRTLNLWK